MRLKEVNDDLRRLGERLFKLVDELSGAEPEWEASSGWYKAKSEHGVFLYFYFVGDKGRKYPPNSVRVLAKWDDSFTHPQIEQQNNWYAGHASADLVVRPAHPEEIVLAEDFIRRAFKLRNRHHVTR